MLVATVPEREVVLIPAFFEVHRTSDIFLLLPSSSDSCVVYNILLVAVVFNGAFVLFLGVGGKGGGMSEKLC